MGQRYRVVAVGGTRMKSAALRAACDDYLSRIRHYAKIEEREVKEARVPPPEDSRLIALARDGEAWTSEQLAELTAQWERDARDVTFVIGDADEQLRDQLAAAPESAFGVGIIVAPDDRCHPGEMPAGHGDRIVLELDVELALDVLARHQRVRPLLVQAEQLRHVGLVVGRAGVVPRPDPPVGVLADPGDPTLVHAADQRRVRSRAARATVLRSPQRIAIHRRRMARGKGKPRRRR